MKGLVIGVQNFSEHYLKMDLFPTMNHSNTRFDWKEEQQLYFNKKKVADKILFRNNFDFLELLAPVTTQNRITLYLDISYFYFFLHTLRHSKLAK